MGKIFFIHDENGDLLFTTFRKYAQYLFSQNYEFNSTVSKEELKNYLLDLKEKKLITCSHIYNMDGDALYRKVGKAYTRNNPANKLFPDIVYADDLYEYLVKVIEKHFDLEMFKSLKDKYLSLAPKYVYLCMNGFYMALPEENKIYFDEDLNNWMNACNGLRTRKGMMNYLKEVI